MFIFWLENMEIEIIVAGLEIPMGQSIVINRHYIIKSIAPLLASCFCILGLTLLRNLYKLCIIGIMQLKSYPARAARFGPTILSLSFP